MRTITAPISATTEDALHGTGTEQVLERVRAFEAARGSALYDPESHGIYAGGVAAAIEGHIEQLERQRRNASAKQRKALAPIGDALVSLLTEVEHELRSDYELGAEAHALFTLTQDV